jgi:hypothetical protein
MIELGVAYALRSEVPVEFPEPSAHSSALIFALYSTMTLGGIVFMLGLIPILIAVIVNKFAKRFFARATSPIVFNFFTLKLSAYTIQVRSKNYRKFIDTEYQKIAPN